MDFITGLFRIRSGYDFIWVVVDRLIKVVYFIPVKIIYISVKLVKIYMLRIVCLYGVLKKVVFARGIQFIFKFWRRLYELLGIRLEFSILFYL